MGRTKGTPKTGGRKVGTTNKVTGTLKDFIASLINGNRSKIEADLQEVEPYQRLMILERLMAYVIPKQQATSIEAATAAEYRELARLIDTLPDEAINRISEKIISMQKTKQDEQKGTFEKGA